MASTAYQSRNAYHYQRDSFRDARVPEVDNFNRVMPQDIEAEKAVLAAMMLSPGVAEEAFMKLKSEEFYRPSHQKIFDAMNDLYNHSVPIDQLSLADKLNSMGELEAIGGRAYIIELGNHSLALAKW